MSLMMRDGTSATPAGVMTYTELLEVVKLVATPRSRRVWSYQNTQVRRLNRETDNMGTPLQEVQGCMAADEEV